MDYYPIFVDLKGKKVLIVGVGRFADEKIPKLKRAGAEIVQLKSVTKQQITNEFIFVFGATGESKLNKKLAKWCAEKHILFNGVDDPQNCHFILPAVAQRGKLLMAVSTSGVSPYLASEIKKKLLTIFGEDYTKLTEDVAKLRPKVLKKYKNFEDRMAFWKNYFMDKLP